MQFVAQFTNVFVFSHSLQYKLETNAIFGQKNNAVMFSQYSLSRLLHRRHFSSVFKSVSCVWQSVEASVLIDPAVYIWTRHCIDGVLNSVCRTHTASASSVDTMLASQNRSFYFFHLVILYTEWVGAVDCRITAQWRNNYLNGRRQLEKHFKYKWHHWLHGRNY